jgi:two-component system NtrC family sensor kinase
MTPPVISALVDDPQPPDARVLLALNYWSTAARLLSGVVHEINNALQVISGTVELLEGRPDLPSNAGPALERLRSQSARAAAALADVLLFTRASMQDSARVNLREVAEHSAGLRTFAIRRAGLTIRVEAGEGEFIVTGNRGQLQQAILNLVTNAEQALAGTHGAILVQVEASGDTVALRVVDDGSGVAVQPREHAFERFVTTRDPWEGAGLGLWAARMIAEAHGGTLTLEDRAWGASFVLRLPRVGSRP